MNLFYINSVSNNFHFNPQNLQLIVYNSLFCHTKFITICDKVQGRQDCTHTHTHTHTHVHHQEGNKTSTQQIKDTIIIQNKTRSKHKKANEGAVSGAKL